MMNKTAKAFSILYLVSTSVAALIMLTTSFEQSHGKYFSAFIAAQQYVMPIILSAMALSYIVFFEPERLENTMLLWGLRVFFILVGILFSYYYFAIGRESFTILTHTALCAQLCILVGQTVLLFYSRLYKCGEHATQ